MKLECTPEHGPNTQIINNEIKLALTAFNAVYTSNFCCNNSM